MKLVTRAQLGWGPSAAPTQASTRGVKVHYEGTPVSTRLLSDHDACIAEWKAIRASHLANTKENYSDIAYNYGACPHGFLLEGRGIGKRTGANGNQPLNIAHYAIVGLVGDEGLTKPTDAMLNAIRDGIDLLRQHGAGDEIRGHRDGYATECPGPALYTWVQAGAPRPATEEDDMPTPAEYAKAVAAELDSNSAFLTAVAKAVAALPISNPARPDAQGNPGQTPASSFWRSQDSHFDVVNGGITKLTAQVGALTATVAALAQSGGLDANEIQAAAEAGAKAALDRLGDALTN